MQAGDNRVRKAFTKSSAATLIVHSIRALRVGYPTAAEIHQAQFRGVDPGGDIMIHGIRNGLGWLGPLQRDIDWTKGCIAVTDGEMDEIWRLVPDATPVEIRP